MRLARRSVNRPRATRLFVLLTFLLVVPLAPLSGTAAQDDALTGQVSFQFWGGPAELEAYQQVVDAFEQRYPEVDVTIVHVPAQDEHLAQLRSGFATGTPPDLFLLNYRHITPIAATGMLEPVGSRLGESTLIAEEDYADMALDAFRYPDGTLVCLPQNLSSLVVYYNRELFEAANLALPASDWTWDDFLAAATGLTDADGAADGSAQYGLATEISTLRLAPFIWQAGGELVDDLTRPTTLTLDTPEARAGLQYITDLLQTSQAMPGRAENEEMEPIERFTSGGAAMLIESRQAVPALRENAGFDWDVAPLPQGAEAATVLHGAGFCMSRSVQDADAAWAFLEFAGGPNGQAILSQTGRIVPAISSVATGPAFLGAAAGDSTPDAATPEAEVSAASPANSQVFLDNISIMRRMPTTSTWPEIEAILDVLLARAIYGELSVDDAISLAIELTEPLFAQAANEMPVELVS